MGRLVYGARGMVIEVDDRLLAHVQAVVVAKLRRNEPFALSWTEAASNGSGRQTVWLHPNVELAFEYRGSRRIDLERKTLDDMLIQANTNTGLDLAEDAHNPPGGQPVTPVS
jgi:hypothetical protein